MTSSTSQPSRPLPINVQDIHNLLVLIDLAAQRGAFKGAELSHVGAIFDRITKAMENIMPKDQASDSGINGFSSKITPAFLPEIGNKNG